MAFVDASFQFINPTNSYIVLGLIEWKYFLLLKVKIQRLLEKDEVDLKEHILSYVSISILISQITPCFDVAEQRVRRCGRNVFTGGPHSDTASSVYCEPQGTKVIPPNVLEGSRSATEILDYDYCDESPEFSTAGFKFYIWIYFLQIIINCTLILIKILLALHRRISWLH